MKKRITRALTLMIATMVVGAMAACGGSGAKGEGQDADSAGWSEEPGTPAETKSAPAKDFHGIYQEVNNGMKGDIMRFTYDEDVVYVGYCGLFDVCCGYTGKAKNVKETENGISIDCLLKPEYTDDATPVPAHITLSENAGGGYTVDVQIEGASNRELDMLKGSTQMYKTDELRVLGTVPVKLGDKITMAGLLKALTPYVFTSEMLAARHYLTWREESTETESVTIDEKNRYMRYAWGQEDRYMECKYWNTDDGCILVVMDTHDGTYEYPQLMRFFKIDPKAGTMTEEKTALSDKWPLEPGSDNDGIVYQVRYESNGIVALVPEKDGDSFDIVTLKFDGEKFN